MRNMTIYLAGGMSGIPRSVYRARRNRIIDRLEGLIDCDVNIKIIDPSDYYNYDEHNHETEKEILRWELNAVRKSDLIIADLTVEKSIGTNIELAIAYENRIPIIGINANKEKIHPWLEEICDRTFNYDEEGLDYIIDYYLC